MKRSVSGTIGSEHVDVLPLQAADAAAEVRIPNTGVSIEALERALIEFALRRTAGNRTRAARLLGLTRSALLYRMHKHQLDHPETPAGDPTSEESL